MDHYLDVPIDLSKVGLRKSKFLNISTQCAAICVAQRIAGFCTV